jgi:sporulation protein YlmC with PRC-barrel domain
MDISIDAKVFCTDGEECGHVTSVLINPVSKQVTHLIVKEHGLLGQERMVPAEKIIESQPEKINLRLEHADFHHMENFVEIKYISVEDPFDQYLPENYYFNPYEDNYNTYYEQVENIPPGELAIYPSTEVYATDGHIGKVDELLVFPEDEKITHLVLREGHLWGKKHVTIPVSEIDRIEIDGVHLTLTKDAISQLPAIPIRRFWE